MSTADIDSDSGGLIRVRGRDGEEVEWSRKAARKAITLRHMMEDTSTSGILVAGNMIPAPALRTLSELCEAEAVADLTHRDRDRAARLQQLPCC